MILFTAMITMLLTLMLMSMAPLMPMLMMPMRAPLMPLYPISGKPIALLCRRNLSMIRGHL